MGRHRAYDVDQVIDAALHAFWARGFEATSISDLVDVTGVNRASLYAGFGDKRGLFLGCLQRYEARWNRARRLSRPSTSPAPGPATVALQAVS